MALDIHEYKNGRMGQLLFQIEDKAYAALQPAFEQFRRRTGCVIDQYGDLVVNSELPILISEIAESNVETALLGVLSLCHREGKTIIFVGD